MKLDTIISFRMPWRLTKLVPALPRERWPQTFNVPPPAGIFRPLWGEYDVRQFDENLDCSAVQRDSVVYGLESSVVLSPHVWSPKLAPRVKRVFISVVVIFT